MSRVWPATLPPFAAAGYQRQPGRSGVRFEPELGPAKQHRRTRAAPQRLQLQLFLTAAQRATFWTFFETTCAAGALSFTLVDPVEGTSHTWQFDVDARPVETLDPPDFVLTFPLDRLA